MTGGGEAFGDVGQADVVVLGEADEDGEGPDLVDLISLHQDSFGLPDDVPAVPGNHQVVVFLRIYQGDRSVSCDGGNIARLQEFRSLA